MNEDAPTEPYFRNDAASLAREFQLSETTPPGEGPPIHPCEHEVVAAMATIEWYCHACGELNDVVGAGVIEGYMECGGCGARSWLQFDLPGFEAAALGEPRVPASDVGQDSPVHDLTWDQFRHAVWSAHTEQTQAVQDPLPAGFCADSGDGAEQEGGGMIKAWAAQEQRWANWAAVVSAVKRHMESRVDLLSGCAEVCPLCTVRTAAESVIVGHVECAENKIARAAAERLVASACDFDLNIAIARAFDDLRAAQMNPDC